MSAKYLKGKKCEQCGGPVPTPKITRGRPRRFCSDYCSKLSWDKKHPRIEVLEPKP